MHLTSLFCQHKCQLYIREESGRRLTWFCPDEQNQTHKDQKLKNERTSFALLCVRQHIIIKALSSRISRIYVVQFRISDTCWNSSLSQLLPFCVVVVGFFFYVKGGCWVCLAEEKTVWKVALPSSALMSRELIKSSCLYTIQRLLLHPLTSTASTFYPDSTLAPHLHPRVQSRFGTCCLFVLTTPCAL